MTNDYYDSFDLRGPIKHLMRNWAWILGAGILAVIGAVAFTFLLPTVYRAEATAVVSPSRTEFQFDERIQTLVDNDLVGSALTARQEALVALVTSNEVIQSVLDDVGQHLGTEERNVRQLRELANVESAGDLINLEILYGDPDTATLIANTWIEHYVRHVNQLYGTRLYVAESRISEQVVEAQANYQSAQEALEAYLSVDPIDTLQQDLATTQAVIENYQEVRIATQSRPADRNQQILNSYYQELLQVEGWLADAQALREQVADDTGSPAANLGNVVALITLRSRAFGGSQLSAAPDNVGMLVNSGPDLQFDLAAASAEQVSIADVEALILALERRRDGAQARVDAFLDGLQSGEDAQQLSQLNDRITALNMEANALQSEIEAASAELRELTRARDNTWETYQLLVSREAEEEIASETSSSEVHIADRAVAPTEPVGRGLIRNTFIAAMLGAFVSAGIILVRAWWTMGDEDDRASEQRERQQLASEGDDQQEQSVPTPGLPDTLSS